MRGNPSEISTRPPTLPQYWMSVLLAQTSSRSATAYTCASRTPSTSGSHAASTSRSNTRPNIRSDAPGDLTDIRQDEALLSLNTDEYVYCILWLLLEHSTLGILLSFFLQPIQLLLHTWCFYSLGIQAFCNTHLRVQSKCRNRSMIDSI